MISRFNYTGRRRIDHRQVRITLRDATPPSFEATWDLDENGFPPSASVYIEATSSGSPVVMRFPFGQVGARSSPDTTLSEITGRNISFTFKVVDDSEHVGRLLGLAENLRPRAAGESDVAGRQPILPVNPEELGAQVWRLNFGASHVWLEVNRAIPGIMHLARSNDLFFTLVYPQVVRDILNRVILVEDHQTITNDDTDWRDLWLRYGVFWHPEMSLPPQASGPEDQAARLDQERWIEDVVSAFCIKKAVRQRFEDSFSEETRA